LSLPSVSVPWSNHSGDEEETHKSLMRQELVPDDVVLELAALVTGSASVYLSLKLH
jgi:hypothetical protein